MAHGGLCIYIVQTQTKRIVILRSDDVNYDVFMKNIDIQSEKEKNLLTKESVKLLLSTMDTEWDRQIARMLLSVGHSRKELYELLRY
jgi:hypothetical protein